MMGEEACVIPCEFWLNSKKFNLKFVSTYFAKFKSMLKIDFKIHDFVIRFS